MSDIGKILLADDEETFRCSTADLLNREGYQCDQAVDATEAARKLQDGSYDLLIADIKMPGNPDLELVKETLKAFHWMPVILVTGYPELNTAIRSIELPVTAYMIKPLDIPEFLQHVGRAVRFSRSYREVSLLRQKVRDWGNDLEQKSSTLTMAAKGAPAVGLESFVLMSIQNIQRSLSDLGSLAETASGKQVSHVCQLMNCPRTSIFRNAIRDAIEVLEKTKGSFKSKELGELRRRLEALLTATAE